MLPVAPLCAGLARTLSAEIGEAKYTEEGAGTCSKRRPAAVLCPEGFIFFSVSRTLREGPREDLNRILTSFQGVAFSKLIY